MDSFFSSHCAACSFAVSVFSLKHRDGVRRGDMVRNTWNVVDSMHKGVLSGKILHVLRDQFLVTQYTYL